MHGRFGWYELVSGDPAQAAAFYGAVVGWTTEAQGPDYTVFKTGDFGVAGIFPLSQAMKDSGARPGWMGYILSDDVDTSVADLLKAGGKVYKGPQDVPGMLRFAVVSDPQGMAFMIFTPDPRMGAPAAPAPMTPGTFGWSELLCPDWRAAWTFYSGLFGWKKAMAVEMGPMGTYQTFGTVGGDGVGDIGGMMDTPPGVAAPDTWSYYIWVDGVQAAVERVGQAGGTVVQEPQQVPGGGWIAQGRDREGAVFSLVSQTA